MDVGPWDLADRTALFLGVNHSSGIADANTRRMYEALRDLVEQHVFGGSSIGGTLGRLGGAFPEDPEFAAFAGPIRRVMLGDSSFVSRVWDIMRHNRPTLSAMPDGPWVDATRETSPSTAAQSRQRGKQVADAAHGTRSGWAVASAVILIIFGGAWLVGYYLTGQWFDLGESFRILYDLTYWNLILPFGVIVTGIVLLFRRR